MSAITESEAKMKWCPMSRMGNGVYGGFNRCDSHPDTRCIASACMAWQWANRKAGHDLAGDEGKRFLRENPLNGYCGAFGKSA